MKHQTFSVTGHGSFPLDMLRHDHCWPTTSEDVARINDSVERSIDLFTVQTISLTRQVQTKGHHPTSGRWQSFGWNVGQVVTR